MLSLRDTQQAFLEGVLQDRPARIAPLIVANGIAAQRRIAIYRNNMREGFANVLLATYPVVARLGGEDWFRQSVACYQRESPSPSGNLHHAGERFASYLECLLAGSEHRYFADVARLEWAYQDVLVAAEHDALDLRTLAAVPTQYHAELRFLVHPAVRLVASAYPIFAIWQRNRRPADAQAAYREDLSDDLSTGSPLRLDQGASRVLLARRADHVEVRELASAPFALLQALSSGVSLGDAAEATLTADPSADFTGVLAQIAGLGVLVDFHLSSSTHHHQSMP